MKIPNALPAPEACWACGDTALALWRAGNAGVVETSNFAITDHRYGITGTLRRCRKCGFAQCSDIASVTRFYQELIDPEYEATRAQRAVQADRLLDLLLLPPRPHPTLLDVGSGSGILVGEAKRRGWNAVGIEPSQWLVEQAHQLGLPVWQGVLPHPALAGRYDCVTLVDVLEHVTDPLQLLLQARAHLSDNGVGLLVTPDAASLAARLLGFRWWHYRVAHVGYFNRCALKAILARAGLEPVRWGHPTWYFPLDYLWHRLGEYLPAWPSAPSWSRRLTLPLNLFDSLFVTFRVARRQ